MNYTITKNGNYGYISPLPEGVLVSTLDKYLQYVRQGQQYMAHPEWAIYRFYKKGRFPWGLLYIVKAIMKKYCDAKSNTFEIISPNIIVPEVIGDITIDKNLMSNLRPYQRDAVYMLIKNRGGVLRIPTAGGKTITIIEYLKLMNMKTLVLVTTLDIKRQWQEYNLPNITVSTYQNPQLKIKGVMESYPIVVCDESHHCSCTTLYTLAMKTSTNTIIIGVSATKRDDGDEMKVVAALGKIVYEISRKELIAQGYLANAIVTYLKPNFQTNGKYMDYQKVYNLEIVHNENRNWLIYTTAIQETQNHRKILILVSTLEHGNILYAMFEPLTKLKVIFMNGQSKNRDQDMTVYDIIIATSIYDEGYNLPSLSTLILGSAGKSSVKLTQRIGRVLRQKADGQLAHVYDFIDTPKYLKSQYLKRRMILEQEFEVLEQTEQTKLNV
jgi:superfamily II DNA or RNA helicase